MERTVVIINNSGDNDINIKIKRNSSESSYCNSSLF